MIRVLAGDIATTSGFTGPSRSDPAMPKSYTYRCPDGDDGMRMEKFEEFVCDRIEEFEPDAMAWEAPLVPHGNALVTRAQTVLLLVKLAGVFELVAARYGCRRMPVNVATVKRFWAGHGRAEKPAMMARCDQLRWPYANDHEADSCAVWAYAMSTLNKEWSPMATPLFAPGRRSA